MVSSYAQVGAYSFTKIMFPEKSDYLKNGDSLLNLSLFEKKVLFAFTFFKLAC